MAENASLLPDVPAADNTEDATEKEKDAKEAQEADDLADKVAETKVE
jgi:hypothetical protein